MMCEINSLNEIQNIELQCLDFITTLCEKRNFRYFLAGGGTLLGAGRHKGFIP